MLPRNREEDHRTSTVLELFFDLTFVIAIALNGAQLHHALSAGHVHEGLVSYLVTFFSIWWAWMNFSWFASAFDNDDWLYRILTFVQMGGVMTLAAGIEPFYTAHDPRLVVAGYVLMRIALVCQWLRASRCGGAPGRSAKIYAVGVTIVQLLWIAWLFIPEHYLMPAALLFIVCEIAVPLIAELKGGTPWHVHHIAERYGLFTIIVMGEGLLASVQALVDARSASDAHLKLGVFAAIALICTASLWWHYFWAPAHTAFRTFMSSWGYSYMHYFVFAAAGAFSVGMAVNADILLGESALTPRQGLYTVAIPIAVFLLSVTATTMRHAQTPVVVISTLAVAALVLVSAFLGLPLWVFPILLGAGVVVLIMNPARATHTKRQLAS